MLSNYIGEFSALAVAVFWTVSAISFESASRKVGSVVVNLLKIVFGFIFLSIVAWIGRGYILPVDASLHNWIWLSVSGFVGFFLGDLFLFKSYTVIGSRFSMLIMTAVPPITAFLGWIFLGEKLSLLNYAGMAIIVTGISMAIFSRNEDKPGFKLKFALKGILFAFGGAIGQSGGLILSKKGMGDYNVLAATQIRLITGFVCFAALITILKRWDNVKFALKGKSSMTGITIGSFFGPFLGVTFSLLSIKYIETGIASTLMALVPVLIIPPYYFIYKQKVTAFEIFGAVISIIGVALFFVK